MADTVRRNVVLDKTLDDRFRKLVAERKGIGKGKLSEAVNEALELWIKEGGA